MLFESQNAMEGQTQGARAPKPELHEVWTVYQKDLRFWSKLWMFQPHLKWNSSDLIGIWFRFEYYYVCAEVTESFLWLERDLCEI